MPRYLPVQEDSAHEEIQGVYQELAAATGFVPNYLKTLAHSPHYLKPMAELYRVMLSDGSLSDKLKMLVILKTCRTDKCKATVTQFTQAAIDAGWTREQIDAMDNYAESDLFNYYEKDLQQLVEEVLTAPDDISQTQFWTQLDNHFTSDQVVEAISLIGFFNMINRLVLSVEIEPDPAPQVSA